MTGTKAAVGPPWFNRYTVPLALVLVLLSGIGPVIAWRRATLANARRNFLWPTVGALVDARGAARLRRDRQRDRADHVRRSPPSWSAVLGQELWRGVGARRAMTSEGPARALVSLVRAQPPALRRLHRPPRHGRPLRRRRRLVGLPARARRAPGAQARRRRSAATRSPTSGPPRAWSTATAASSAIALGADLRGAQGRPQGRATCTPSAATTRRRRRSPRAGSCAGSSRARRPPRSG